MDKDIQNRMVRIVGNLESLHNAAKAIDPMPCDKRTRDLLESAKIIINKAMLSAWEYADSAAGGQS
jgi:hypothetical protein